MFQDTTPFVLALVITFTFLVCISIWNSIKSPSPYKKGPAPEPGPSRTREILSRFSEFYNNLNPEDGFIYDTAILPDPKQHIIHALYVGYDESESDEDREAIKRGLNAIANFQDLIGDEPLKPINKSVEFDETITENLFLDPENQEEKISVEEKNYNEYINRIANEIQVHFEHLKIEKEESEEPEDKEERL